MEFSGQHDKATYFKAIRWIYKPSKRDLWIRILVFAAFAVIYIIYLVTAFQKEGVSMFEAARIFRHLVTFLILGYFLLQPVLRSYLTASRLWSDPLIRRRISGRISSQGIQIAPSRDWMAWGEFVKIYKDPDLIVLLTAARLFVILPRKFFQSDDDWKFLRGFVNTKIQEVIE